LRLPKNSGGPARPLNVGIRATTSELIAVLDQDDVFAPSKLERQADVLRRRPELAFTFSLCGDFEQPARVGHERQRPEIIQTLVRASRRDGDDYRVDQRLMLRLLFMHGNFVIGYPAFMFRRQLWERKGELDEGMRIASDYDLLCTLCFFGHAGFTPEGLFLRRSHDRNLSRRVHEWQCTPDEIVARQRCFDRQSWLLEDPDAVNPVREQVITMAAWLRGANRWPLDFRLLWQWRLGDPGFAPVFLEQLPLYAHRHCDTGRYDHALRLLWHSGRIGGWNRPALASARAVLSRWLNQPRTRKRRGRSVAHAAPG